MNAKTIRILDVPAWEVESEEGWTAPVGWRLVASEPSDKIEDHYRITIVC